MGLLIDASIVCDKDLVTTVQLQDIYGPLPEGWMHAQGYMDIASVSGYFCPVCIQTYGTRALFKVACDISPDLTEPEIA